MSSIRRSLMPIFIFQFFVTFALSQISYNPADIDSIAQTEAKTFGKMALSAKKRYSPTTNITYARLKFYIQANKDTISGNIMFVYEVLKPIDSLVFSLNDTLQVDSVKYHRANTSFIHAHGLLRINLSGTVSAGSVDSVSVYYHGHPPAPLSGFGSFTNGVHGTNNDSVVWTLSEPYGASDWWPCKNDLSDKIDSCDIYITTPNKYIASANGAAVSQGTNGRHNYFHFKLHYPVATYLIGIAASNYSYFDTTLTLLHSKVSFTHTVYPESYYDFKGSRLAIGQAMYLYDSLYGAYPFNKDRFGVTQFGWGGGMEHETNAFVHDNGYELNVHEMAHQWFGDKITLGSWQDIWLNEGWAVYSSMLCYQYRLNGYWWPRAKQLTIQKIISLPGGSVWCNDTTSVSRIFDSRLTYKKGALLLHMLRWELGDSMFFSGVRDYISDTGLCYKFARTQQFKQHLEASSGKSLDTFFNQWYMGQGYPSYYIQYHQSGSNVTIDINQKASHPSVSKYNMHLPIELKSTTGKDTMLRLWNADTSQTYTIHNVNFKVDSLIFDPQWWLVAGNHSASFTGIADINELRQSVVVFPNPAAALLNIYHSQGFKQLVIYDMTGNAVLYHEIGSFNTFESVNISHLHPGAYILHLQACNGQTLNKSFIKE